MICPSCKNVVSKQDSFCTNCGFDLDSTVKCPVCNLRVSKYDSFCVHCGTKISEYKKCLVCHSVVDSKSKYCTNCGSKINDYKKCPVCNETINNKDKYCVNCGSKINEYKRCLFCNATLNKKDEYCIICGKKQIKKTSKNITSNTYKKINIKTNKNNNYSKYSSLDNTKHSSPTPIIIGTIILLSILLSVFLFKSYTITYHNDDGLINYNPTSYKFIDEKIMLKDLHKDGYDFNGWYENESYDKRVIGIDTMSFGNIDLYAKFTEITYRINYDLDGGTNNPNNKSSYTINSPTTQLYEPTKEGYYFVGWFDANSYQYVNAIDPNLKCNIDLIAMWEATRYSITYHDVTRTENQSNPYSYTIEDVIYFNEPIRKGHTFEGFYLDNGYNEMISCLYYEKGNKDIYAKWSKNEYLIFYDLDGGYNNPSNPDYYTYGQSIYIQSPTKDGYTFAGWKDAYGRSKSHINSSDCEDIYLYATWNGKSYSISYSNTKGASNPNPRSYRSGDYIVLYDLGNVGSYIFDGWYDSSGNLITSLDADYDKSITLYARWRQS